MSQSTKCSFNADWTNANVSDFASWIKPVPNDVYSAQCAVCCKTFRLSNMGKTAVSSHAASVKHKNAMKALESGSQTRVFSFFKPSSAALSTAMTVDERAKRADPSSMPPATSAPAQITVRGFLLKKDVAKAEIVWCMNAVMTHASLRCVASSAALFPLMFQSCEIAKKMQLGKDKVGYTICHGIAPFFRKKLLSALSEVPYIAVAFDDSLNKVAQKEQMDVLVRYCDSADATVKTRYLTSCFLGHTCSEDLTLAFKKATEDIKHKILQVSMDGPNVNLRFLRSLKEELACHDSRQILEIGSCGLHVVHGAFKTGHAATGWNLVVFLRSIYNLFKYVPARRADYIRITASTSFPLKFCAVRWLENSMVISRALQVLPHLIKYVECSAKDKSKPKCTSFTTVETLVADTMLPAKLAFMLSVAEELKPFLTEFQTDEPMVPFLAAALEAVLRSLMGRIIKQEILRAADTPFKLLKIDLEKPENIVFVNAFDVGFAAKSELRKAAKPSQLALLTFKKECISFLKVCSQKIMERSPLKYRLTTGVSCLDPVCALSVEVGKRRLAIALEILTQHRWLTGLKAERAHRSYVQVCSLSSAQLLLKNFDRTAQRLDTLWFELCSRNHKELLIFAKIILTMSHGNAAVERGFSVNKECLIENLNEESLIAQRIVYDGVSAAGGVANVDITDSMVEMVRGASIRWKEELKKKKQDRLDASEAEQNRKRAATRIKELQQKKQRLITEAQNEASLLQEEIDALK
ncbi:uncharacterized protein LOC142588454 [Dermacentor variabilis]|uniref:uncharacterized protein LOC142588454 n=1 Tax=Dermacentor variabilis TaxID=34621 RepID=UPI003F5C0AAC